MIQKGIVVVFKFSNKLFKKNHIELLDTGESQEK